MRKIKCALLIFFLFTNVESFARSIVFEGLNKSEQSELEKQFPQLKSERNSLAQVDQIIQKIMEWKKFEEAQAILNEKDQYVITATPLRILSAVEIEGNRASSKSELFEIINLDKDDTFEKRRIREIGEKLKKHYGDKGYFNAIIEVGLKNIKNREVVIEFKINEGLPCRITTVEMRSKNPDLNLRLKSVSDPFIGRHLTNSELVKLKSRIQDHLMTKKYYSSELQGPQIVYNDQKSQARLIYNVNDPFQYQVYIEGANPNTPFYLDPDPFKYQKVPKAKRNLPSENEVRRALSYTDGERTGIDPEAEMTNKIRNFYLNKGYPEVKVSTTLKQVEGSFQRNLIFNISTGPKVRVSEWLISGRISRPQEYYIEFIQNNSSDLVNRGYYNSDDLSLGEKNLITELRNQGFLMAKIQSTRIEYIGKSKSRAKITINLDEGPLTQVRRMSFIGNKAFTDLELENIFTVKSNAPLRLQNLEVSIATLKRFYLDRGYLEMKILNDDKNIVKYNDKGTHADIEIRLFEGPQVTVKSILVEGNSKTHSDVIKRGLSFEPEDVLTPNKIEDSVIYLNRSGIFTRVSIDTLEQGTDVGPRTVVVSVDERDPGLWRLGAGVNSERELTARAFTGLSYNNLGGTMRGVSTRLELSSNVADINYLEHRITAGYLEPFLFGTKMKGRVNLTRSDEVYNTIRLEEYDTELVELVTRNRIDFLIESDLTRDLKLTWTVWGLDSRTTRERKNRDSTDPSIYREEDTLQIANIGPVLALDYRDNPFMPRDGNYSRFAADYSAPFLGSSTGIEFVKVEGTYRHYFPFFKKKLVWANELRSGYLSNLSDAKCGDNASSCNGVPASHAFIFGGFSTVRGYDFNSPNNQIPKGTDDATDTSGARLPIIDANDKVIKSDSHYYMVKTELRFPIYGDFGGVVFYDGGAVLVSGYNFEDSYRESVGFGFRYNTPVGPVSMDLGWKIDRQSDETPTDFHFSIGTF